jgi:GT2 family glycosyltransferase
VVTCGAVHIPDLCWDQLPPTSPQTRHTVTAVIVAHDGASMLPGLVQALHAQTHAVGRIVGVDTGSRDRSGAVLADLIGQDAVFGMDRATGFGQAVWGALRRAPALRPDSSGQPQVEWVWLLHDDCEPVPETLERLLRAASRDRSVVVLGPKVLDGAERRVLREAGISIDRSGRRVTGIDPGEFDQGQHDHNRAVLSVGSAGMLIRRDAWEQLGGFDTHLRLFRDDLDFCWRVHSAGYRVQVVTDAVLYHRELTARRRRMPEGTSARRLDRRNALYVLAVNLPLLSMLWTMAGCVGGTLIRAVYFLLTKQLDQAADQVHALGGIIAHPVRLWKARRRRAPGRARGYDAVRSFIAPSRPLRQLSDHVMSLLSPQGTGGAHHAGTAGAGGEEDEQFIEPPSLARRIVASHGVQLVIALLVIALVAERRLLGTSPLGGGALVPAWGGASALWTQYLASFHAVGVGSAGTPSPYVAVVAALATVFGGQAWLAVDVLLLGCVPLAGLSAYLASSRLTMAPAARVWLAAAYALVPVASGAVAAGRLGAATVLILIPLIARAAGRMLTAPPRQARSAAWATGLLVGIASAFVPLVWVITTGLTLATLVVRRWAWPLLAGLLPGGRPREAGQAGPSSAGRLSVVSTAIVVLTPLAVLFPWSVHLLASPSAFLLEAGVQPDGLSSAGLPGPALRPDALLLLSPGGPGLPPLWVTAGFGLAVIGTLLRKRTALVLAGWAVAVAGFAAALAVSRSAVVSVDGAAVRPWPGAELAIAAAGLLIAAAPAAEWLANRLASGSADRGPADGASAGGTASTRGWRGGTAPRMLALVALVVVASAPVMAAWFWVTDGVRGPIAAVTSPVLPPFVAASASQGFGYRTLVLRDDDGTLSYSVLRQADPTLGEPELAEYAPADQALARLVAALGAPVGADAGDPGLALGEFGIRWVLLPSPVDAGLAQRLDASEGLVQHSTAPAYDLWQVTGPVSGVRVVGQDGTVTALSAQAGGTTSISGSAGGGTLVLAEPYGGWTATFNGHALTPLPRPVDGWAQGFTLPAGGGQLAISRDDMVRDLSLIAELIAFLAAAVLALPGKRSETTAEAQSLAVPPERGPGSDADRPAGRRAARGGARSHVGRTDAGPEGTRRRPVGAHAGGAHASGPRSGASQASFAPAANPTATRVGPAAEARDAAPPADTATGGVGLLAGNDQTASLAGPATLAGTSVPDPWRASDWALDPDRPQAVAGQDRTADTRWAEVIAERDSGAWPALSGNTPPGNTPPGNTPPGNTPPGGTRPGNMQPASTRARDTLPGDTPAHADGGWSAGTATGWGTGPNPSWATDPGSDWGTGPNPNWSTDASPNWSTDASSDWGTGPRASVGTGSGRDRGTGPQKGWNGTPEARQQAASPVAGQPWEPMTTTAGEPADDREAGSPATDRKPAERHSHRARRHGRPARRIWDRADKDKDGES